MHDRVVPSRHVADTITALIVYWGCAGLLAVAAYKWLRWPK